MLGEVGEIVERRLVSEGSDARMEWQRVMTDETGNSSWMPKIMYPNGTEVEPAFMPLPGSQYLFLSCPIFEALYEGTRGPGKTLTLIMDFAKDVGKGYGKAWRGILFRRHFKDLDDVARKIEEWFPLMFPGFRFLRSASEYMAVWPDGEALLLRHITGPEDYEAYHGHEYPWIGWEELTQHENDKAYKLMMSCCRPPRPGIPCRVRSTTNPYGAGHNWVKKRFRLPDFRGKVIRAPMEMPRIAIHGTLAENFVLLHGAPEYAIQIKTAAKNPSQESAWLFGSWDVTSGGMIDDLWQTDIHILPTFPSGVIPYSWTVTRSYDHGQSSPFSTGWWLESSGEPIIYEGRLIGNVRGDLILWEEWYGTTGEDNEGLRMSARDIARGIIDRDKDLDIDRRVQPGPADTEIFNAAADRDGRSPADDMEGEGVYWERANKSAGSRKRGWELLRNYLSDSVPNKDGSRENPGLFVCDRCRHWIELCPPMPRDEKDPDEVSDKYEDHAADMTRYRLNWEVPVMWRRSF